jgi:hypothetical protein
LFLTRSTAGELLSLLVLRHVRRRMRVAPRRRTPYRPARAWRSTSRVRIIRMRTHNPDFQGTGSQWFLFPNRHLLQTRNTHVAQTLPHCASSANKDTSASRDSNLSDSEGVKHKEQYEKITKRIQAESCKQSFSALVPWISKDVSFGAFTVSWFCFVEQHVAAMLEPQGAAIVGTCTRPRQINPHWNACDLAILRCLWSCQEPSTQISFINVDQLSFHKYGLKSKKLIMFNLHLCQ